MIDNINELGIDMRQAIANNITKFTSSIRDIYINKNNKERGIYEKKKFKWF